MANEIKVTVRTALSNGGLKDSQSASVQVDQAAAGISANVHDVTTGDTAIDLGEITTLGWLYLQNLDATNFVDVGPEATGALVPFLRLQPGEVAVMPLKAGIVPRWQADTATVKVLAKFYEA